MDPSSNTDIDLNNNASDQKQSKDDNVMHTGDCVLLLDRSRKCTHITVNSPQIQRINRMQNVNLSILENKIYGSVFELKGNILTNISALNWKSLQEETNLDNKHLETKDNQKIFHQTNNQKLTQNEILKMKLNISNSNNSDKMINKIASSSKTFHLKTEFSKEKYIKNKKKKHTTILLALKPSSSNLTEMYFYRKPDKTMGLRIDSLSQILTLANIHSHQNVLIVESCTGLIVGSCAERMNSFGKIFNIYCSKHPVLDIGYNLFNLNDKQKEIIYNVNIGLFNDKLWINDNDINDNQLKDIVDTNSKLRKYSQTRPNLYNIKQWIKYEKCDSLILCNKYNPLILFKHLYKYLDYGCPFVVWSEYIQSLILIKKWLKDNKHIMEVVDLRIHENWLRELQVLPQRTHPMVNMHQLGGYILSGIKVKPRPSNIIDDMDDNDIDMDIDDNNDNIDNDDDNDNDDTAPNLKKRKLSVSDNK